MELVREMMRDDSPRADGTGPMPGPPLLRRRERW